MKAVLIFLITFSAIAHEPDCFNCEKPVAPETLAEKLLNWFSSPEAVIKNAPCKTKLPPSEITMKAFIKSKMSGLSVSEVNGIYLKEAPVLIQALTDFTTAKTLYGSKDDIKNQKNFQNIFAINPKCEEVLCAMEKIWDKEMAIKILYVNLKYGFNMSEYAFEKSSRFNKQEMDDVIIALEDLPPHLTQIALKNQRLTHYTRGEMLSGFGSKAYANSGIILFDKWTGANSSTRQYTTFHELAHMISTKFKDMDESPEWLALSGWEKYGNDWEANGATKCFISNYGKANPWEDFAESISAYRYNGNAFKTQCPVKYYFIKSKVMNDIEYLTDKSCKP